MWERIDHHKLRNVGGDCALSQRVYGQHGGLWPRLTLSLYEDVIHGGGIKVASNKKHDTKAWWEECGIPEELLPDVVEMLQEHLKGIENA